MPTSLPKASKGDCCILNCKACSSLLAWDACSQEKKQSPFACGARPHIKIK